MKHAKLALIGLVIMALALPACTTVATTADFFGKISPPKEQVLRFNNASEPRSVDPHKTAGIPEFNIMINLYEMLTTYEPKTLAPVPGMAERWEALDNARRWKFYLRKNAQWTDGRPVTAHDFVWAWQRGADPKTAAPYQSLLFYVKNGEKIGNGQLPPTELGVRALDDYTLEVEMERPTAFFVKMTAHYIYAPLPRWAIEAHGDNWTRPGNIVTNGAFILQEHKPYNQIVLVKNPKYFDADKVKLEKAIYLPIDDNSTVMNLYKAGEVYTMQSGEVPLHFVKALKPKKDYIRGTYLATYYYSFNVKRKPLDDPRVRRALNMAINKEAIAYDLVGRGEAPATHFVPPGIADYPEVPGPGYDPEQAKRLLAEAGYPNGQGFPKLTFYYNTLEAHRQIAEAIQRMWKETLNIQIELQNEEWQTHQARRERRDFDICRDAWTGDYLDPNTFLDIFANDGLQNHSGWTDPEYTRLIEEANAEPDQAKRAALLTKAEQMLNDNMPFAPIYYYALNYMKKPFVDGWYKNLLDIHPLKYVSIREDWTIDSPIYSEYETPQPDKSQRGF